MAGHQQVTHHFRVVLLQHITNREEIAQRLGHLVLPDTHCTGVHPHVGILLTSGGFGLGDLVLVMREGQVRPAAVDIEGVAQAAGRHRGALDMPARTARAPGRRPAGLARLGGLPQHEVERVFLGLFHFHARAGLHVIELTVVELAVALETTHTVVDITVAGRVGKALVDQRLGHRDDIADVRGRPWLAIRPQDTQTPLVFVHRLDHALGQRLEGFAILIGSLEDLVVDIGNVAHIGDVIATRTQVTRDDVEGHHHTRMADVTEVIDRHATDVHAHLVAFQWHEGCLGPAQGTVDGQCARGIFE